MKILVVDSSHDTRAQVVGALSELHGVVVQGAVGELTDAMRALEDCPLDGVVTRSELPDGDVLRLIEAARRRCMPTMVVYGAPDSDARRQTWLEAGASHVVEGHLGDLTTALRDAARLHSTEGADRSALLGRMTAGVAHDLNNYLAAAEIALTYAERTTACEARVDLRAVRASLDGMTRLAKSLTQYARGDAPAAEPIELGPLVRRTLECFRRVIPDDVRLVVDEAPLTPAIRGVPSELEQLVMNVVINASDEMPGGGTLWLMIDRQGTHGVRLEAACTPDPAPIDDGFPRGGAAAAERAGRDRVRRSGGALGLGIVRRVVESHAGTLRIGRALGGGAKLVIVLPAG